jgi:Holliday junction resolvasome RuvABC ATP-dependent DNA helicase subunit
LPEDFAGVAAEIEPAPRPPADIGGYLAELDGLVGLDAVKEMVADIVAAAHADEGNGTTVRHLIFTGSPGVGKATVAGLLGGIYAALGMLDSGHLVACSAVQLAGRDAVDTEMRVSPMAEQAMGGVLLIEHAERLVSAGSAAALLEHVMERRDEFMIVCSTTASTAMAEFLASNPGFRAEFAEPVEFASFTDRQLVKIFQRFAERDLYMLDEELRVELLARFARLREAAGFAYATTVRRLFDEVVARQANRLAGPEGGTSGAPGEAPVTAGTVTRLTVRDLPESVLEQLMGHFREDPGAR